MPNLVRYAPTGMYYGRAKVAGRQVRERLGTSDFELAQTLVAAWRIKIDRQRKAAKRQAPRMTMGELLDALRAEVAGNRKLAASTRANREYAIRRLEASWPGLRELLPQALTYADVHDWMGRLLDEGTGFVPPGAKTARAGNSASGANKALEQLGAALDIAVRRGMAVENVARIKGLRAADEAAKGYVPSREEFRRLLELLPPRDAYCALLLASTGCRLGEARALRFRDVDLDRQEIAVPGTKTAAARRRVPLLAEAAQAVRAYRAEVEAVAKGSTPDMPVFPRASLRKPLAAACAALRIPRVTNHDLRDYYTTTCLEAGIPVHTVATWLGHADGGALLLRRYAHLRDQHALDMAKQLKI